MSKKNPRATDPPASAAAPGYAEARARLDRILKELEEGEVEVDALADRVEEAAGLVSLCRARLREQEARLRKVAAELSAEAESAEARDRSEEE